RGHDHFAKANYAMIGNRTELFSQLNFENTSIITEEVMKGFVDGDYDRVEIVYNQFKNAAVQILSTEQLLPLEPTVREETETQTEVDYIFEPSKEKITEDLIPKSIKIQLYKAVLDSHASEHGA